MKTRLMIACTGLPLILQAPATMGFPDELAAVPAAACQQIHLTAPASSLVTDACFDTELAAVHHAVALYNPTSIEQDREFMGVIFQQTVAGQPRFGYTVARGEPGQDQITIRARLPAGSRKTAFWHTHGADHWSRRYFSATDTQLARQWGLPFYLATAQGELRVFHPEDRTMNRREALLAGLGDEIGASAGRLVRAAVG